MEELDSGWRKSSYSGNGGNCVEVAGAAPVVLVRDTKNHDGAVLTIPADAWRKFIAEQQNLQPKSHGHGQGTNLTVAVRFLRIPALGIKSLFSFRNNTAFIGIYGIQMLFWWYG